MEQESVSISEVTRREIFDALRVAEIPIYGRMSEVEFLDRVFRLEELPSHDPRFRSMKSDIHQHTVNNNDWADDWIFSDSRLDLWNCPDQVFLKFLTEMVHPLVRPKVSDARDLVSRFNEHLRIDGWEVVEAKQISGKPVFAARQLEAGAASSSKNTGSKSASEASDTRSAGPGLTSEPESEPPFDASKEAWHSPSSPDLEGLAADALGPLKSADVVIMTATKVELFQVLRLLKPHEGRSKIVRVRSGPETYFLGVFGSFRTAVTLCAMGISGPISSAQTARSALEMWKPAALIMTGIAWGASRDEHAPADVLIASQIIPYEVERAGIVAQYRGPIAPGGPTLLNRFSSDVTWKFNRPDGSQVLTHFGPVLSGEKLIDDPSFKESLLEKHPGAIGGEMEGAGIFASASREGTEWILVKGVCDWADGKKSDQYQEMAAAASASFAAHVLSDPEVLDGLARKRPARKKTTLRAVRRSASSHSPSNPLNDLEARGKELRQRLELDWGASGQATRRRYFLQAFPNTAGIVRGLHDPTELRKAFEEPPATRHAAFTLGPVDVAATLPGGGITVVARSRVRSLTRTGLLTWSGVADRDFLAHAAKKESEFNINPMALVEATYGYFSMFLQYVLPALNPRTATWTVVGGLAGLREAKPYSRLCRGILDSNWGDLAKDWSDAPASEISFTMTRSTIDPGEAAFGVLQEIYEQWGLGENAIPFTDGKRIEPKKFPRQ